MDSKKFNKSTGMVLDGVAAAEVVDSSGEVIEIKGLDISDFEEGHGFLNWEHKSDGDGEIPGINYVGIITYAKKIFKESDCEDDRQRMYWKMVREHPYLYIVGRMFDGAGHKGAEALAAMIRDFVANGEPIWVRYSIEGNTLTKKDNVISKAIAKRLSLTVKPCDKVCWSGLLYDPQAPAGYDKKPAGDLDGTKDFIRDLYSRMEKSGELTPSYPKLNTGEYPESAESVLRRAVDKLTMFKTLTAGTPSAAPGERTGGAALQVEDIEYRKRLWKGQLLAAIRDYDKKPFDREDFKAYARKTLEKMDLSPVDPSFVDYYADVAEKIKVPKITKTQTELKIRLDTLYWDLKKAVDGMNSPAPRVWDVGLHNGSGGVHHIGRYMLHNNAVTWLEDPYRTARTLIPEGPVDDHTMERIHALKVHNAYEVTPVNHATSPIRPPTTVETPDDSHRSVFEYLRAGVSKPSIVEIHNNVAYMNGHQLDDDEQKMMLHNLSSGVATVRYPSVAKSLSDAPDEDKNFYLNDSKIPSVQNDYSFRQMMLQPPHGVWVVVNGSDTGIINTRHGFDVGDQSVAALGGVVGKYAGKSPVYRTGGDNYIAVLPSEMAAAEFLRGLRSGLEAMPPIGGDHPVSASVGVGYTYEDALEGVQKARVQRVDRTTGRHSDGWSPVSVVSMLGDGVLNPQPAAVSDDSALFHAGIKP